MVALVLFEWAAGLVAAASWTQSWSVVKRGHFRIVAWSGILMVALAWASLGNGEGREGVPNGALVIAFAAATVGYLLSQYARRDGTGIVIGCSAGLAGAAVLVAAAGLVAGWPVALAAAGLLSGAALLGAVTNGMLLGHWYLNQPGLKPWALGRLTSLALASVAASGIAGAAGAALLVSASTEGAAFGPSSFGGSFAPAFFAIWAGLLAFTGVVVWMARHCVRIRSIQSATGLYYVAILTAGVAEFLVRYLMLSAA